MTLDEAISVLHKLKPTIRRGDGKSTTHILETTALDLAIKILEQESKTGRWIPVSEKLPEDDKKQYIVQKTNGFIDILGFTKDAYKLDKYDFAEYKGKNKQLFYKYDSEYGYIEWKCEAWQPLPEPYKAEQLKVGRKE